MKILRSAREIGEMRKAGLVVWQALQVAKEKVAPGATTKDIDLAVDDFFAKVGAVPLFKGVPGPVPFPAATCISVNEEVVHGIPGSRVLTEGDIVSVDTGCKLHGWCGDSAVTFPVGAISPEKQKLLDVTSGVLDLAIRLMGEKSMWSEVASEMAKFVRDEGLSVVECFVGHGIGREMHEAPQVPNFSNASFRRSGDFRLEPGLVVAVEPMVNLGGKDVRLQSDHWTQSTVDGKASAHFEHTIAITKDGPRLLTAAPEPGEALPW